MQPQAEVIIDLERKFWQSMVDDDTDTALAMLCEPALMVSQHGAMKFGHEQYRKMAEKDSLVLKAYELSDMEVVFPNENTAVLTYHARQIVGPRANGSNSKTEEMHDTSTWVRGKGGWKCVAHTETPAVKRAEN